MARRVAILAVLAAGLIFVDSLRADDPPVTSAVIERVGFSGKFKVGRWTPLAVRVEANRACDLLFEVEVADPDGNRTVWPGEFHVDSAGSHRLAMLFQPGRLNVVIKPRLFVTIPGSDERLEIPVVEGEEPEAKLRQTALTHATLLVGTFGSPGGLEPEREPGEDGRKAYDQLSGNREKVHVAPIKDPADFTVSNADNERAAFTNASGLESLDTIVISGRYDLTEVQSEALKTWVTLGGHLIVSVGKDLDGYEKSPLASWVSDSDQQDGPETFRLTGSTTFLRLDTLESYAGKNSEQILIDRRKPVPGVKIEPANSAQTELRALSGPLIVRAPYGMGTVTFLGLSLSDEPIASWPSLPRALRKLLWDTRQPASGGSGSAASQLAYSGVSEFATQLQTVLVAFPSVQRLSTWAVIGLMTVYLLVIGPIDYLLVHQLLRRPRLTWLTLPVLIAASAFLAAWMAQSQNGTEFRSSQVDVIDYDASTRTMRSRSWASLYSPETRRYHVALKPAKLAGKSDEEIYVRMSWFGTPESSFGGMYREGGQQIQPPQYRFSPGAESVENLPIPIWGAKSLTGEWCTQGRVWVESDLESPRLGQLRGTIRHNFPAPITDWFVAYSSRVFLPRANTVTGEADPLVPGSDWPRGDPYWDRVRQREIGGYLTRTIAKQSLRSENSDEPVPAILREQQPYDPLAKENPDPLSDIFRILSFHRQVGGKQYSGLDNHFFRGMDLSDRLNLDQAVLFGRIDLPAAELEVQDHAPDKNLRATFVRIVLPVRINHEAE